MRIVVDPEKEATRFKASNYFILWIGDAIRRSRENSSSEKFKHCCLLLSFEPRCGIQGQGSPLSSFFKDDLFRLEVNEGGICVKCITDRDSVGFSGRVFL